MAALAKLLRLILPTLLDWAFGKVSRFVLRMKTNKELEKKQDARLDLAAEIEAIKKEIGDLLAAGKPVPQELKDKLREKSRLLIHS